MTRSILTALLLALLLATARAADAHFIWIETAGHTTPGTPLDVSLYFGEPHESLREETGGLLDRHDELQAWVVDPRGEKVALALRKEENRFHAVFTPRRPGRHQIIAASSAHEVMDLTRYEGGLTRPLFYARAQFLAFAPGRVSEREAEVRDLLDYDIVPVTRALDPRDGSIAGRPGHETVVRLLAAGQPVVRRRLHVFGPNGWVKELQPTDSWGVTSFVPLWPGRYVVALERDEKATGDFRGRHYDVISRRVTLSILVEVGQ